jgi:hypothetical protein
MRIAVADATGNIGARTIAFLLRDGRAAVRVTRSLGIDLITGEDWTRRSGNVLLPGENTRSAP